MPENKDILKTSIGIDFGQAKDSVKEFGKDVDVLSQHFNFLSSSVSELKLSVAGVVKKQLQELSDTKSKTSIDVSNALRKKIETAIAKTVLNKEIEITDSKGEKITYDFKLNKSQMSQLNRKIAAGFMENFDISKFDTVPVTLTREHKTKIRKKFSDTISDALSKPDVLRFEGLSSRAEAGIHLDIDGDALNTVLKTIRNELVSFLSDPTSVKLTGLEPIEVDSVKLREITNKIKDSIVSIDKHLNVDVDFLEDLPPLDATFRAFREELRGFVNDVVKVTNIIDTVEVGTASKDVLKVHKNVEILKKSIVDKVNEFVKEAVEVLSTHPLGTIDFTKHQQALGSVVEQMETSLLKSLEDLKDGLLTGVGLGGGKDRILSYIETLKEKMEALAVEGINELTGVEVGKINTLPVAAILSKWSEGLSSKVTDEVITAISEIQPSILEASSFWVKEYEKAIIESLSTVISAEEVKKTQENLKEIATKAMDSLGTGFEKALITLVDNTDEKILSDTVNTQSRLLSELVKDSLLDVIGEYRETLIKVLGASVDTVGGVESIASQRTKELQGIIEGNLISTVEELNKYLTKVFSDIDSLLGSVPDTSFTSLTETQAKMLNELLQESLLNIVGELRYSVTRILDLSEKIEGSFSEVDLSDIVSVQSKLLNELVRDSLLDVVGEYRESLVKVFEASSRMAGEMFGEGSDNIASQRLKGLQGNVEGSLIETLEEFSNYLAKVFDSIDGLISGVPDASFADLADSQAAMLNELLQEGILSIVGELRDSVTKVLDLSGKIEESFAETDLSDIVGIQSKLLNELVRDSLMDVVGEYRESLVKIFESSSSMSEELFSGDADNIAVQRLKQVQGVIEGSMIGTVEELNRFLIKVFESVDSSIANIPDESFVSLVTTQGGMLNELVRESILSVVGELRDSIVRILDLSEAIGTSFSDIDLADTVSVQSKLLNELVKDSLLDVVGEFREGLLQIFGDVQELGSMGERMETSTKGLSREVKTIDRAFKKVSDNLDKADIKGLQKSVRGFVRVIGKLSTSFDKMADEKNLGDPGKILKGFRSKVNKSVSTYLERYVENISSGFSETDESGFSIKTKSLHRRVRKEMADSLGKTVKQFVSDSPVLEGTEDLKTVLNTSMKIITRSFNETLNLNIKEILEDQKEAQDSIVVEPEESITHYTLHQIEDLQSTLIRKIKEIIREQFGVVIKEIKELQIVPQSIGLADDPVQMPLPRPVTSPARERSVIAAPAATTPQALSVSALPAVSPASTSPVDLQRRGPSRFSTSIKNTARYLAAGAVMGAPMTAIHSSWNSFKEFDYEFTKAVQNMYAKYRGVDGTAPFEGLALKQIEERHRRAGELGELGVSDNVFFDPVKKKALIEQVRSEFEEFATEGIIKPLQQIGVQYALPQAEMGKMFQISTKRYDNPYEALAQVQAASRVFAVSRGDVSAEEAARGIEAIAAQWGIDPLAKSETGERVMDRFANMLIKASIITQASTKDILEAQSKAGGVFKAFLPEDMSDERKFATSVVMSAVHSQATGRPGSEAGTFWRRLWAEPFKGSTSDKLAAMSRSTDPMLQKLNPYEESFDEKGLRFTKQKSGFDMFKDIADVYSYLKENERQKEANELVSLYAKTRNFGSYAAIMEFLDNLDEKMKDSGVSGLDSFIDKTYSVLEEEVDAYFGGLTHSTKFKQDKIASQWQAATSDIFRELKPEMDHAMDSLIGFFRKIEENAEATANVLGAMVKMLMGFGLFELSKKAGKAIHDKALSYEYAGRMSTLKDTKTALLSERSDLYEKYHPWEEQYGNLTKRLEKDKRYKERLSEIYQEMRDNENFLSILRDESFLGTYEKVSEVLAESDLKAPGTSSGITYDFLDGGVVLERYRQKGILEGMSKPVDLNIVKEVQGLEKSGYSVVRASSGMVADYGEEPDLGVILIDPKGKDKKSIEKAAKEALLLYETIEDEKGKELVRIREGDTTTEDVDRKKAWSSFVENLTGIDMGDPIVLGGGEDAPEPVRITGKKARVLNVAKRVFEMGGVEEAEKSIEKDMARLRPIRRKIEARTIDEPTAASIESMQKYKEEIDGVDKELLILEDTMSLLKKSFEEMGVDSKKLDTEFASYMKSLKQGGSESKETSIETAYLTKDVEKLNRQFKSGAIDVRQYAQALHHVKTAADQTQLTEGKKVQGTTKDERTGGVPVKKPGKGLLGGTITAESLSPILASVGNALTAGAGVLISSLVVDSAMQAIGSSMLTDAERQSHLADNLEKYRRGVEKTSKYSDEGKHVKGFLATLGNQWNFLKWGIAESLGDESAPSFYQTLGDPRDWLTYMKIGMSEGKEAADKYYDDLRKTEIDRIKREADAALGREQREQRERYFEDWVDIRGDGVKRVDPKVSEGSLESIQNTLKRLSEIESQIRDAADVALVMTRAEAALTGKRQDSLEVLESTGEYYQVSVEALKDTLEVIEWHQEEMVRTRGEFARQEEGFLLLEGERLKKEKELHELYIKQLEVVNLRFQEIDSKYSLRAIKEQSASAQALAGLYIEGQRKDSREYLEETLKGARETIVTHTEYVSEIERELKNREMTAEVRQEQEAKIAQYEAEIATARERVADIEQGLRVSSIPELSRQQEYSSKGFDIMRYGLSARGYGADSVAVRMLQKQQLEDSNRYIDRMITGLQEEYSKLSDKTGWQAEDLLMQIRDLEAQSASNIANIFNLMNNTATWGLPAGIEPITSYEYEARKSSERSVAIQQGNITVSVKFDTVYARSEEEVQQNIVDPITKSLEKVNRDMTERLNRQVSSYVSNYR